MTLAPQVVSRDLSPDAAATIRDHLAKYQQGFAHVVEAVLRQQVNIQKVSTTFSEIEPQIDALRSAIIQQAKACIIPEKPFVLDLSGVTSFCGHGITIFDAIDEACDAVDEEWSLIPSTQVSRTLRLCGIEDAISTASSVHVALHHFSDVAGERRSLLPILIKSA